MLRRCEREDRPCAAGGGRTLRTDEMRDDCRAKVWQSSLFKEIVIAVLIRGQWSVSSAASTGNGSGGCCWRRAIFAIIAEYR